MTIKEKRFMITSYKDFIVWQKAIQLTIKIYKLTDKYPKSEQFGLTSQIKRCAISIPSNIAEGQSRFTRNEFRRFLLIAYASSSELETQLEIGKLLNFGNEDEYTEIELLLIEIRKILNKLTYQITHNTKD